MRSPLRFAWFVPLFWLGACSAGDDPQTTPMGPACHDTTSDPANCGACGVACSPSQLCNQGLCVEAAQCLDCGIGGTGGAGTGGSGLGGTGAGTGGAPGTGGAGTGGGSTICGGAFFSSSAAAVNPAEYTGWKNCWVKPAANGTFGVINSGSCASGDWVVSEGIGYGMLLAVANDDRPLFDGLWQFYLDHVDPAHGLMNWSVHTGDAPGDNDSNAATDGDLDVAMALLQAERRWGGYASGALTLITNIRLWETEVCSGLNILKPGDRWGGCSDNGKINPSYFAPGYYRVFAQYDTANAAYWAKLADDSYPLLASYQAQLAGLVPEWAYLNGSIEGGYDYNACRTPWRIATDYAWFCTPAAKTFLDQVVAYVDSHGGIAGTQYAKNSAFLGGFATAGIAHSQAKIDAYVPSWLNTAQAQDNAYFQGSLRLVYALLAGNQFPSTVE